MIANKINISKPDNLLLENSMNIFHLVMPMISSNRGAGAIQDLRARLAKAFSDFEKRSFELQLDTSTISDVKYAMAAFVDEKVLSSAWPHKHPPRHSPESGCTASVYRESCEHV